MELRTHCNECGGDRHHLMLFEEAIRGTNGLGHVYKVNFQVVRCEGCAYVSFRRLELEPDGTERLTLYPSRSLRKPPQWLAVMWIGATDESVLKVERLLSEVYIAVANDCPNLAAMGIRAAVEQMIVHNVSDRGSFVANLEQFQKDGFISGIQRRHLEAVLEVGHASIHRGYDVSMRDVTHCLEIVESVVQTLYINEHTASDIKKRVPPRQPSKPKTSKRG